MAAHPKKVLVISYYWPPSGGAGVQRWVKFCKYLPEFNIQPILLTVKGGTYPLLDETLIDQVPSGLSVYRSKIIEPYSIYAKLTGKSRKEVSTPATAFSTDESFIQKIGVWIRANFFIPDARRGWVYFTLKKAKKIILEHGIDTIITTGPPNSTHLIGTKLKQWKKELNWIMDMRDPWSKIFFNQTIPRTKLATYLDERYEKKALKLANEVIVVSESMVALQKTIIERTYHPISNGFDHTDFPVLENIETNKKLVIKYVGSMTEPAIPYGLFSALKNLPSHLRSEVALEFFGSINSKVVKIIEEQNLGDVVSFHGYVPHLEAKKEMQKGDLLLLVIPNTDDNELILTGKIFDYIAAQKPIICIGPIPGDASDIIIEYKLGFCFDYNDSERIQLKLEEFLRDKTIEYSKWDKDFKTHPFSRYSLTAKLSTIINKL